MACDEHPCDEAMAARQEVLEAHDRPVAGTLIREAWLLEQLSLVGGTQGPAGETLAGDVLSEEESPLALLADAALIPEVAVYLDGVGALDLLLGRCMRCKKVAQLRKILALLASMATHGSDCAGLLNSELLAACLGHLVLQWSSDADVLLSVYSVVAEVLKGLDVDEDGHPTTRAGTMCLERLVRTFVLGEDDALFHAHLFVLSNTTKASLAKLVLLIMVFSARQLAARKVFDRHTSLCEALSRWTTSNPPQQPARTVLEMGTNDLARAVLALVLAAQPEHEPLSTE